MGTHTYKMQLESSLTLTDVNGKQPVYLLIDSEN